MWQLHVIDIGSGQVVSRRKVKTSVLDHGDISRVVEQLGETGHKPIRWEILPGVLRVFVKSAAGGELGSPVPDEYDVTAFSGDGDTLKDGEVLEVDDQEGEA